MRRLAAGTMAVLGAATTLGLAAPADAGEPWTRYHQEDSVVTAERSTCGFDVSLTVVEDRERYRTLTSWPNGSPRKQVYKGSLVMLYTNLSTGASVVHDLGSTGVFRLRKDGTPRSLTSRGGPFGTTMPVGSAPQTGIYVLSGKGTRVTFRTDDTRTYRLGAGGLAVSVCPEIDEP